MRALTLLSNQWRIRYPLVPLIVIPIYDFPVSVWAYNSLKFFLSLHVPLHAPNPLTTLSQGANILPLIIGDAFSFL